MRKRQVEGSSEMITVNLILDGAVPFALLGSRLSEYISALRVGK